MKLYKNKYSVNETTKKKTRTKDNFRKKAIKQSSKRYFYTCTVMQPQDLNSYFETINCILIVRCIVTRVSK